MAKIDAVLSKMKSCILIDTRSICHKVWILEEFMETVKTSISTAGSELDAMLEEIQTLLQVGIYSIVRIYVHAFMCIQHILLKMKYDFYHLSSDLKVYDPSLLFMHVEPWLKG